MEEQRREIDDIDSKIFGLYQKRFELTDEIGRSKKVNEIPLEHDTEREKYLIAKAKSENPDLGPWFITDAYFVTFEHALRRQAQVEKSMKEGIFEDFDNLLNVEELKRRYEIVGDYIIDVFNAVAIAGLAYNTEKLIKEGRTIIELWEGDYRKKGLYHVDLDLEELSELGLKFPQRVFEGLEQQKVASYYFYFVPNELRDDIESLDLTDNDWLQKVKEAVGFTLQGSKRYYTNRLENNLRLEAESTEEELIERYDEKIVRRIIESRNVKIDVSRTYCAIIDHYIERLEVLKSGIT